MPASRAEERTQPRRTNPACPSPARPLLRRLVDCVVVEAEPDQVTVNEYLPGQGIGPHVDAYDVFEEPLLSLSLLSLVRAPPASRARPGQL